MRATPQMSVFHQPTRLLSLPLWLSPFLEGLHSFFMILASQNPTVGRFVNGSGCPVIQIFTSHEHLFEPPHGQWRIVRQFSCHGSRFTHQFILRNHSVDKTDLVGPLSTNLFSEEEHLTSNCRRDKTFENVGPAWNDAKLYFGNAELH